MSSKHSIISAQELDKGRKASDKVFVDREQRDKLEKAEADRAARVFNITDNDEYINLMKPPKMSISRSEKMNEPATMPQIYLLKSLGLYDQYDEDGNVVRYTKTMVSELLNSADILPWMKSKLVGWGFNPTGAVIGQFLAIQREMTLRKDKEDIERMREEQRRQLLMSLEKNT